jgi:hypothetical protein
MWHDPQARFSIGAPPDWMPVERPTVPFGSGVIAFRDPSGLAELSVAVDTSQAAVSPELYAASLELAMQKLPGYALENVQPGSTAGDPSVKRTFTVTQKDAGGSDYTARGFQIAVVRGSTAYVVAASAPADQFAQFAGTFDRMVNSFSFS